MPCTQLDFRPCIIDDLNRTRSVCVVMYVQFKWLYSFGFCSPFHYKPKSHSAELLPLISYRHLMESWTGSCGVHMRSAQTDCSAFLVAQQLLLFAPHLSEQVHNPLVLRSRYSRKTQFPPCTWPSSTTGSPLQRVQDNTTTWKDDQTLRNEVAWLCYTLQN